MYHIEDMEENFKLLEDDFFQIPQKRNIKYFPDYVQSLLREYLVRINKFTGPLRSEIEKNEKHITDFCNFINKTIALYYNGLPSIAFETLKNGIETIEEHLHISKDGYQGSQSEKRLFRARKNEDLLSKEEFFHIPFQSRGKVSTQRYSIPGHPSLYLCNSVHLCWEELDRPPLNMFQVSRYEIIESARLKFLYLNSPLLSLQLHYIDREHFSSSAIKDIINYVISWPLIACCTVEVLEKEATFKPEYMIPQLLFQWVKESKNVDGVIFHSTKIKKSITDFNMFYNYAIPAKITSPIGHCNFLKERLKLTDPVYGRIVSETYGNRKMTQDEWKDWINKLCPYNPCIPSDLGRKEFYGNTIQGKLEYELAKTEATLLKNSLR